MLAARAGPDMAAGVAYFTRSLETGLAPETLDLRGLIAAHHEIAEVVGAVWRIPRRAGPRH
jgi:hypothetical protein